MTNLEHRTKTSITVIADGLTWMTILGCVQLALRHPDYTGPSSNIARQFADQIADALLSKGVLTPEELAIIMRDQMLAENSGRKP